MNVAAPTPARNPGSRAEPPHGSLTSRGRAATPPEALARPDGQRHADDFAELLQRKAMRSVEPGDPFDRVESADAVPAFTILPAPALARVDAAPLAARSPVGFEAPEALQPALRALQQAAAVDAPASPVAQAVGQSAWEVTIQTPGGVPLQLKVARAAEPLLPLQPVPGGWTLTLTAPARETAAMNRHAPRLNERLRERSLSSEPVRIEAEDAGDPP